MERFGLRAEFTPFIAGGPLNQALLGDQLDVGFIGAAPVVSLVANGGKAKIIARIADVRDALIVKADSPFKTVKDLKGKTIASFVGSNTYLALVKTLQSAGLDPSKDVQIIHLSPDADYGALMKGDVDAYDTWDPYTGLAQERGGVRVLAHSLTPGPGLAVATDQFLTKNREAAVRLLEAITVSIRYMAKNKDQVNTWLHDETKISKKVIEDSSEVDANYRAAPGLLAVKMDVTDEDKQGLKGVVDYLSSIDRIKTRPNMADQIDTSLLREARARLQEKPVQDLKLK